MTIKIKTENLSKIYHTDEIETHAISGIDLTIYDGDYVTISGPSGSGKSTLLSILGLLDQPSGGTYLLDGADVSKLTLTEAARVRSEKLGFVFQQFNLIDELSVFDNIALPFKYHQKPLASNAIKERVEYCLSKVDMSHRINHKPNQLSGGQQQRIAIARALATDPAVLLVDEPTGNLDSKSGDMVMELLNSLNESGTTICMVTHDIRYADMAKRNFELLDGVLATQSDLKETVSE